MREDPSFLSGEPHTYEHQVGVEGGDVRDGAGSGEVAVVSADDPKAWHGMGECARGLLGDARSAA